MEPVEVPNELVVAAVKAIQTAHSNAGDGPKPEFWDEVRIGLAAVLPLHEQQLRERIGEFETEWYVRWPAAGSDYHYELCLDEQDARETAPDDGICEVGSRLVGEFKVADDA